MYSNFWFDFLPWENSWAKKVNWSFNNEHSIQIHNKTKNIFLERKIRATTKIFIKNIALFFITVGRLIFHKDSLSIKTVAIFISKHVLKFLVIDLSLEKCDWFFFPIQTKPKTYLLQFYFLRFYTCFLILSSSLLYWDRPKNFKLRKRSQKKARHTMNLWWIV